MNNNRVLWLKVWGIASVQGAITLSWVIYNLYLPLLLVQLGLSKQLAVALLIVENALEAIIEPVFGGFSDQQHQRFGSRIPIISIGIILSSALFLTLPSLVIFNNSEGFGRWLLPVLAVAWASAMAIFRSPVMALLGRCAPTANLPQAASILTLVGGIVGAFRFDAYGIILKLGPGFAFTLGSFSLLAAGAFLRWLNPSRAQNKINNQSISVKVSLWRLSLIFITGIGVGWGLKFLIPTVSQILTLQLGPENTKIAMTLFFIGLGLLALPAGKIGTKLGNSTAMIWGSLITVVSLILLAFVSSVTIKYLGVVILLLAFSLVVNGAVPFALALVDPSHSGLGVGMYFGGLGAGISLFEFIFSKLGKTNIATGTLGASLSFLLVLLCLVISDELSSRDRA